MEWIKIEMYHSSIGEVTRRLISQDWEARVRVGEKLARISETYGSAEAAMKAVERTHKKLMVEGKIKI